jgi:hypothetical protein
VLLLATSSRSAAVILGSEPLAHVTDCHQAGHDVACKLHDGEDSEVGGLQCHERAEQHQQGAGGHAGDRRFDADASQELGRSANLLCALVAVIATWMSALRVKNAIDAVIDSSTPKMPAPTVATYCVTRCKVHAQEFAAVS